MNAVEIIEEVRRHGAELLLREGKLVLRGSGPELPPELQDAVRQQKAEIMVALGAPIETTVASILADIRPHLPPALRTLPDGSLLVMVNWTIMHAWNRSLNQLLTPSRTTSATPTKGGEKS